MFGNFLNNVFGVAYVKYANKEILIGGINTSYFFKDMETIWGSKKALSNMFNKINKNYIVFDEFWAIDILYMFEQIALFKKRKSNYHRIKSVVELLRNETWLKSMNDKHDDILDFELLKQMKHTLFEHQLEALKVYNEKIPKLHLKGYLLNAVTGSGKTIMGIGLGTALNSDIFITVCPKSLVDDVWNKAFYDEFGHDVKVFKSTGSAPLEDKYKYYIFHYEFLNKAVEFCKVFKDRKVFIMLDESHNLNEITSMRTKLFIDLVRETNCQHTVFSSGTPVKAMGSEMIPLLMCLDKFFNDRVALNFKEVYGISAKRAVDVLRHRLDIIGHKIIKLPEIQVAPPIESVVKITIPNSKIYTIEHVKNEMREYIDQRLKYYKEHMREVEDYYFMCLKIYEKTIRSSNERKDFDKYNSYIKQIRRGYDPQIHQEEVKFCNNFERTRIIPSLPQNYKAKFKDVRTVIKYVYLKVLGEALGRILSRKRSDCHEHMVPYMNLDKIVDDADKKVIIFSSYVGVIKAVQKFFIDKGYKPVTIYGETAADLNKNIEIFRNDPGANPLIASLKMLSTGVTLINASHAVFADLPFRDYIKAQAIARIYRIGQNVQTFVTSFVLDTGNEPNVSSRMMDILDWSKQQTDAILGKNVGTDDLVGIVEYLQLNPKSPYDKFVAKFKSLFS